VNDLDRCRTMEISAINANTRPLHVDGDIKRVETIALFEDERVIVIRDEQLEELHALVHDVSSKPRALAPDYTASLELIAAVDSTWIDMTLEAGEVIDDE